MRAAEFLNKRENFERVILVFILNQITEEFVEYFGEKCPLAHGCFTKKEVNLFPQFWVIFVQIEEHYLHFVIVEREHFVETLDAV